MSLLHRKNFKMLISIARRAYGTVEEFQNADFNCPEGIRYCKINTLTALRYVMLVVYIILQYPNRPAVCDAGC